MADILIKTENNNKVFEIKNSVFPTIPADTITKSMLDSSLRTEINNATSNVSTLQNKMTTAESDIDDLESGLSTTNTNVSTLSGKVATAEGNISTLQTNLSTLQTAFNNLKAGLTSKGDNTHPVYLDANGAAQPITQAIGNMAGLSYETVGDPW